MDTTKLPTRINTHSIFERQLGIDHTLQSRFQSIIPTIGLFLCSLPGWAELAHESTLILSGQTEFSAFGADGATVSVTHTEGFRLVLGEGGGWHMQLTNTIFKDGHFEALFDGEDNYWALYSRRLWSTKEGEKPRLVKEVADLKDGQHVVAIAYGAFPTDVFPTTRFAWLALASADYLKGAANNAYTPASWLGWSGLRREVMALGFEYGFSKHDDRQLGAPGFVAVVASNLPELTKVQWLDAPETPAHYDLIQKGISQFKSMSPGMLAAEYRVLNTTNLHNQDIPIQFELDVYWPGIGSTLHTNKTLAQRYVGRVTNIVKSSGLQTKPPAIGKITVTDYRFRNEHGKHLHNSMRYQIADGNWKGKNDAELTARFNSGKHLFKVYDGSTRRAIKYGAVLACVLICSFVIFTVNRQMRRR